MTTAHTDFDPNNPQSSQAPVPFSSSALNDVRALRDAIINGRLEGFIQSRTQGTGPSVTRPQFVTWYNSSLGIGFRWNITWTGFQITSVTDEWTNDSNVSWLAINSGQVNTFDVANNITSSTQAGGIRTLLMELWTKTVQVVSDLATHMASTGSAVHGLASMAIQAASAVAITGGLIDGTAIGQTVRALLNCIRTVENGNTYSPAASAGVVVDWSTGGGSKITANGTNAITFANIPTGLAGHVVDVSNLNSVTWPAAVDWGLGGAPSIAGRCLVNLITNDAGTKVFAAVGWRAV